MLFGPTGFRIGLLCWLCPVRPPGSQPPPGRILPRSLRALSQAQLPLL